MHAALIQATGHFEQFAPCVTLPSRTSVPNPVMRDQYGIYEERRYYPANDICVSGVVSCVPERRCFPKHCAAHSDSATYSFTDTLHCTLTRFSKHSVAVAHYAQQHSKLAQNCSAKIGSGCFWKEEVARNMLLTIKSQR